MKIFIHILLIAILLGLCSCSRHTADQRAEVRSVFEDTLFTDLFLPKGKGFTGSDATYSVVLPDGKTLWIFGDTFLGNVTADNKRIKTSPLYIRNSFVLAENGKLITYHQGEPQEFKSMMIPPEVSKEKKFTELELWYWPGDALIEKGKLNVFVSKFFQHDKSDMWGFEFRGTELVEFSLPDLNILRIDSFTDLDSVHYGHAICETAEYTYIYGLKKGNLYAARADKNNIRGSWKFWDRKEWSDQSSAASPMLDFSGSEQFSVFEYKGKFVLICQGGNFSTTIYSFTADTPFGPWSNQQALYDTPVPKNCKDCFTYNAVAHPQFTQDNYLLVSYNTNSMTLQDHYDDALIYRPRFIRVPFEMILRE